MPKGRYTAEGGPSGPPMPDIDLELDAEPLEAPELDPLVEEAAVRAFPELDGQPERILALVDLIRAAGAPV